MGLLAIACLSKSVERAHLSESIKKRLTPKHLRISPSLASVSTNMTAKEEGRKKVKDQSYCHIPVELVRDILSRLPDTSLCRFKCVSKSWRSMIINSIDMIERWRRLQPIARVVHHNSTGLPVDSIDGVIHMGTPCR